MMSIVVAAMFKIAPNDYIKNLYERCSIFLVYGEGIGGVGIARAVIVILDEGRVLDSIVQATLVPLQQNLSLLGRSITLFL